MAGGRVDPGPVDSDLSTWRDRPPVLPETENPYSPSVMYRDWTTTQWADAPRFDQPLPAVSFPTPNAQPADPRAIQRPLPPPDLPGPVDQYGLTMPDTDSSLRTLQRYNDLNRYMMLRRATQPPSATPTFGNTPGTSATVTTESMTAPTMKMKGSTVTGQMPGRQQQAMNFAKALGFEVSDDADAAAVHAAFTKATRGMSVAKLLSPKSLDKTRALFSQLLTQAKSSGSPSPSRQPPL